MQRYFVSKTYQEIDPQKIILSDENVHHMLHVMRMTEGSQCYLVFLDQVSIVAKVKGIVAGEEVIFEEIEKEIRNTELPVKLTIACGFSKGEKLEWIVQKCTELGASHFIFFPADRSVVKWDGKKLAKRQSRLQKISKEAAEQAHRSVQPTVVLFEEKSQLLDQFSAFQRVAVAYEEAAREQETSNLVTLLRGVKPDEQVLLLFGPEGGFSSKEMEEFLFRGAISCGLGPRILRAETAPLYALSAASYQLELAN